jgi:ElaA protein
MIRYQLKEFTNLSPTELYQLLRLRAEIFVVEQNCVFLDMDEVDYNCYHLMGFNQDDKIVTYTRIVPPQVIYKSFCSIGRVVIHTSARANKEGYRLMELSISYCKKFWPNTSIKIGAQAHLANFYAKTGFTPTGQDYMEDGIPHTNMILYN